MAKGSKAITYPKKAIVSGSGSGIGRAIALRLAEDGAEIGLLDLNAEGLAKSKSLIEACGGKARAHVVDVRDLSGVEQAVKALVGEMQGLEAAVAAAGIARLGPVHEMEEVDWDAVIDVNLKGVFSFARAAVPFLLKAGVSSFTAISSDAGLSGAQDFAAYCAAKHGVIGLIKAMALDYGGKGLRCNAVCPGFVETPMADEIFAGAPPETLQTYRNSVPMKRFSQPEEVAGVVAHLASSDASYTNGNVYLTDGGSSAGSLIGAN